MSRVQDLIRMLSVGRESKWLTRNRSIHEPVQRHYVKGAQAKCTAQDDLHTPRSAGLGNNSVCGVSLVPFPCRASTRTRHTLVTAPRRLLSSLLTAWCHQQDSHS